MSTTADKIAVMQAYERGEAIELRNRPGSNACGPAGWAKWNSKPEPVWDWASFEYRVAPKKGVRYLNIYPEGVAITSRAHNTKEDADKYAHSSRVACIRVEYTEGQYDA